MTPTEAAALLTICAAYDNRKPDADAAKAWAMALDGLRFEDCRDAIVAHHRASRDWITPSHVVAAVKKVRGSNIEDAKPIPMPAGFDPDDTAAYQQLLAEGRRAQAEGREPDPQPYTPTREFGELRGVLKSLPPAPVKPEPSRAEHDARMAEVRAELDAKRAAMSTPDAPPHPASRESEQAAAGAGS